MIYRFKITSEENKDFNLEIDIHKEQTWLDFHNIIQKSLGYNSTQMASFYQMELDGTRGLEITLFEMNEDNLDVVPMDVSIIREFSSLKQADFIYVFDFFSDRYLNIKLTNIDIDETAKEYPVCNHIAGDAPLQMLIDGENFESLLTETKKYETADDYLADFDDEFGNDDVQFENLDDYQDLL